MPADRTRGVALAKSLVLGTDQGIGLILASSSLAAQCTELPVIQEVAEPDQAVEVRREELAIRGQ